ncbi:sugar phosphate isomerase/epimerase [Flavobacteriaceae bacterium MAR_2009_75]|nr:sugar phosphate isomerase/epimerase [Flavobacteriaceae bacterium MAR_2009_75]
MKPKNFNRRKFLGAAALGTAGLALRPTSIFAGPSIIKSLNKPNSLISGVQIGVITYSFRSMPDQSAEATLQYVLDSGISAIELMGDPAEAFAGKPENPVDRRAFYGLMRAKREGDISNDQAKELAELQAQSKSYNKQVAKWREAMSMKDFKKLRKMYNDAGVSIYAFKPRAFGKDNSDAEINWGMQAAKALGASHVTVEHPSDDAHTLRLGKIAKKNKIYVGYHGHEQQTPTLWDIALKQSQYNALNLDLGHYVAAGNDKALEIIKAKSSNIKSMHLKDRQTPENEKGNLLWGSGDTPIAAALQLMRDNGYKFPGTIELEYKIPEGSNAVDEVKKCLAYCEKALK